MKYLVLILFMACAVSGFSQDFKLDKDPIALNLIEIRSAMVYPEQALANGIESNVIIKALIDVDGTIAKLYWVQGDTIFYRTVIDAAFQLKFEPGVYNKTAVRSFVNIPFTFSLAVKNRSKENESDENK